MKRVGGLESAPGLAWQFFVRYVCENFMPRISRAASMSVCGVVCILPIIVVRADRDRSHRPAASVNFVDTKLSQVQTGNEIDRRSLSKKMMISD